MASAGRCHAYQRTQPLWRARRSSETPEGQRRHHRRGDQGPCRSKKTSSSTWSRSSRPTGTIKPFLITEGPSQPASERTVPARTRALRRHHQVHPVCGVHHLMSGVLDRRPVLRTRPHRRSAHRFIFDSRDKGASQRLEHPQRPRRRVAVPHDFNCTEACPRGIPITQAIQEVKRALDLASGFDRGLRRRGMTAHHPAIDTLRRT